MDLRDPGTLPVAKPRSPNVLCQQCGNRFTWKQIHEITNDYTTNCPKCNCFHDCFSVDVEVRSDNEYLLYETPRYWWHITERGDWAKNRQLNDLFVHVGTAQTVRTYHDILVRNRDWKNVFESIPFIYEGFHLYRVTLSTALVVNTKIAKDSNDWPVERSNWDISHKAYKYVNQVEVPGSISLLVPYRDLTNVREVSTFSTRTHNKEA